MPILLKENNLISLRTAYVHDDGNLVSFRLDPADLASLVPKGRKWWAPKDFEWVSQDSVWLYRHMRSSDDELMLKHDFPCLDQDLKPMIFREPPKFRLLWTDSGHSVAIYLNEEPWASIYEETHHGYSKGIIKPLFQVKHSWDHDLFEKTFLK